MIKKFSVLGSALVMAMNLTSAQAAPVTVDPWHTAGNGNATWPSGNYAVTGLVLNAKAMSGWGNTTIQGNTAIWALGFSDLQGISYAGSPVIDISLMPLVGNTDGVTLFDFDLGIYGGANSNVQVRIYNGDYSQILSQGAVAVGALHGSYTANNFSLDGLHIQFSSSPEAQHAIDNIRLEGGNPLGIAAVPVPAAAWLFGSGLLGLIGFARKKK